MTQVVSRCWTVLAVFAGEAVISGRVSDRQTAAYLNVYTGELTHTLRLACDDLL